MSQYARFLILSQTSAIFGSVISVAGVIFLFLLGSFYNFKLEQLVAGHDPIRDPTGVARGCYSAAFIYIGVFGFCYFQVSFSPFLTKEEKRDG